MRQTYKRLSELVNSSGIEYNDATGKIVASEEWWNRKIKENVLYKDFKDRDVNEIYIKYRQLFGDSYDTDKYAITPMKLCRTRFSLYEDSALEDNRDAIPMYDESSGSSDEVEQTVVRACENVSSTTGGSKRKSSSAQRRGKKKKMSTHELSFSIDRATSAVEEMATKIHMMMASNESAGVNCVEELLAIGRLEWRTPLYFYACQLLAHKQYRDMLAVMKDADEKFEWNEWMFNDWGK